MTTADLDEHDAERAQISADHEWTPNGWEADRCPTHGRYILPATTPNRTCPTCWADMCDSRRRRDHWLEWDTDIDAYDATTDLHNTPGATP